MKFSDDELKAIDNLNINSAYTWIEIADEINLQFHKGKSVRSEEDIFKAIDIIWRKQ